MSSLMLRYLETVQKKAFYNYKMLQFSYWLFPPLLMLYMDITLFRLCFTSSWCHAIAMDLVPILVAAMLAGAGNSMTEGKSLPALAHLFAALVVVCAIPWDVFHTSYPPSRVCIAACTWISLTVIVIAFVRAHFKWPYVWSPTTMACTVCLGITGTALAISRFHE